MADSQKFLPVLGAALAIAAGPVWGDLVPISQNRQVDASGTAQVGNVVDLQAGSTSAPDFSLFNAVVDPLAVAVGGGQVAIAQGVASQISSLNLKSVLAQGTTSVGLTLTPPTGGAATASANSVFQYEFTLTVPSNYWLTGLVDTVAVVTGGAALPIFSNNVLFEDLGQASILFDSATFDEAFSLSGVLDPGTYRLSASASVMGSQLSDATTSRTVTGISSFEFDFKTKNLPESNTTAASIVLGALGGISWLRRRRASTR